MPIIPASPSTHSRSIVNSIRVIIQSTSSDDVAITDIVNMNNDKMYGTVISVFGYEVDTTLRVLHVKPIKSYKTIAEILEILRSSDLYEPGPLLPAVVSVL
jgi:hypothetical protein